MTGHLKGLCSSDIIMLCNRCMRILLAWGSLICPGVMPSCASCAWIVRLPGAKAPLGLNKCFPGSLMQKLESLPLAPKFTSPRSLVVPPMGMPGISSSMSSIPPICLCAAICCCCVVRVGVLTDETVGLCWKPKLAAAGVVGWEVRRPCVRPEVSMCNCGRCCCPKRCLVWCILWLSSNSIVPTASSISMSATASISSGKLAPSPMFIWLSLGGTTPISGKPPPGVC